MESGMYIDGVDVSTTAQWRVTYVDTVANEWKTTQVEASTVVLGPGGALVFQAGPQYRTVTCFAPSGWDAVSRVQA